MKAQELASAIEEFQTKLSEHKALWGASLAKPIPDFPIRNHDELAAQVKWLSRRIGALRPFIERFHTEWIMTHPMSGQQWDALQAATGLTAVAPIKAPSMRAVIETLDQVIGRIQSLDPETIVPDDPNKPLRPGMEADQIMLAYLNLLHPYIDTGCSQLFRDGHYTQAVNEGAKALFQYLRDVTGADGDGAFLVQTLFSLKNPTLAFSDLSDETKRNEQSGFMEMLVGFAKGVRNPLAHSHGKKEEAQKAFEYLTMISLLCRRIDDATPKLGIT